MAPILPPNQLPVPLPPWARLLLQLLPFLPQSQQSVLDYIAELFTEEAPVPTSWVRSQIVWEHTSNIDPADRYVNTFDVVNITNGAIDSSWTTEDFTDLNAGLSALVTGYLPWLGNDMRCKEYRHYLMTFKSITPSDERPPGWVDDPYINAGAPVQIVPDGRVGSAATIALPAQVSISLTEKTPYPRHWGRSYLPGPSVGSVAANGYIGPTCVIAVADAANAMWTALAADELYPVVPVVQVDKQPFRGLLQVSNVQVDNVYDVIRRRRAASTTQRVVRP